MPWNVSGIPNDTSAQFPQTIIDRYQGIAPAQQSHAGIYSVPNASYQSSPIGSYPADGRGQDAYQSQEALLPGLDQSGSNYGPQEFADMNIFTSFPQN